MRKLVLVFTHDVSLKTWKDTGLWAREVRPYLDLARHHGWSIDFLTGGDKSDLEYAHELAPIRIVPLFRKRPDSALVRLILSPFCFLTKAQNFTGVSVVKTNQFWGGWNAVIGKYVWGSKMIARCGYEYLFFAIKQKYSYPRCALAWVVDWLCYKFADQIVLATQEDADFARRNFSFLRNITIDIQPNWVDTDIFKPDPNAPKQRDLVFVGRLTRQKNLSSLIEAVKIAGCHLDIYGDGEDEVLLKNLVEQEDLQKIRFMGRVSNAEIPLIFRDYKIFILPSLFEGNPKALLEAMACGMAVIGTRVAGIQNLIEHDRTGILAETDAKSLSRAIQKLLQSEGLQKSLGENARAFVSSSFSYSAFIREEVKRLEKVAGIDS